MLDSAQGRFLALFSGTHAVSEMEPRPPAHSSLSVMHSIFSKKKKKS